MRIRHNILSVETTGDRLRIKAQGRHERASNWRPWETIEFTIPDIGANRRAFRVGRDIEVTIEPKGRG